MALFCRIKQVKLDCYSYKLRRCFFQFSGACLANHAAEFEISSYANKPSQAIHRRPTQFCDNVRFFAAPVQARKKEEETETSGPRINEQIKTAYLRLVTEEGHSVMSRSEALERARSLKLDLVEVQRSAKPPVCKIMDYHKERYKKQLEVKEKAKSKPDVTLRRGDCKEVRFAPKTELKDLKIKADAVKRLMERGYRVKCMALGTEEQDLGGLLSRLSAMIEDVAVVESGPRVEKRQAYIVVRHIKFGPPKKGGKKVSKAVYTMSSEIPEAADPSLSPVYGEETNSDDSGLEDDDDLFSRESVETPQPDRPGKSTWSVFDRGDDISEVFDLSKSVNAAGRLGDKQTESKSITSSSRANNEFSGSPPSRMPNFMGPNVSPSLESQTTENRYKQTATRTGPGTNDRRRPFNQRSNSWPGYNAHSSSEETKQGADDASAFRSSRLPQNMKPQGEIPVHVGLRDPDQGTSTGGQGSPTTSHGIFSVPTRTSSSTRPGIRNENGSGYPDSPMPRSDTGLRSRSNGAGNWGKFSRENGQ